MSDANLRIGKRMFFTATERVRAEGAGEDDALITMDDEAVYGPRAYSISFRQAAARGIIVPFKIIVSVVNDDAIGEQELAARAVRGAAGERLDARSIANLSALSRAMQEYGLSKAITFHGEVARAKAFAELPAHLPFAQGLSRLHVNGSQSPGERREQMLRYAQADGARAAITNARCLTEGVNVPATDIVAFHGSQAGQGGHRAGRGPRAAQEPRQGGGLRAAAAARERAPRRERRAGAGQEHSGLQAGPRGAASARRERRGAQG